MLRGRGRNHAAIGRGTAPWVLSELVRSLGGHIFIPGTETYADQAALAPAASALDSQVGYVGSASTQGLGENWILDSTFTSATSSALPAGWYGLGTANGVTAVVSGKGVDAYGTYQEIAFSGTAGGTTASLFLFIGGGSASSQHPAARSGELWSAQLGVRGVSGIQKECGLVIREITSGGYGSLTGSAAVLPVNGNFSSMTVTRRLTDTATTKISYYYQITVYASSGVWNQVIRIYAPQLERGHPTAYTPTYGTAISRGMFASAAQGTLADTPKLRGKVVNYCNENSSNPTTTAGLAKSGDAASTISIVSDTAAINAAGLNAQPFGCNGNVFCLDNTAGSSAAYATFSYFIPAGPTVTASVFIRIASGMPTIALSANWAGSTSGVPSGTYTRLTDTATLSGIGKVTIRAGAGAKIYFICPMYEIGPTASAYVPTTSAPASSGTPPLLEFDGLTDHLVTDITSTSSGHIGAIFQQDRAIGAANSIFGCSNTSAAGVLLRVNTDGRIGLVKFNTAGSVSVKSSTGVITPGGLAIATASWTPTTAVAQINGAAESVSSDAINPVGTGILTIGTRNVVKDGAVSLIDYLQGKIGVAWYIPATVPDATQARIRQLVGQIYGVSTL